jgi:DNA-binding transcriptional MerR regulator
MKIGELARRAGLNPSAIRYYEKVGVLNSPYRASGQRRYADDALDRVLLVTEKKREVFSAFQPSVPESPLQKTAPIQFVNAN